VTATANEEITYHIYYCVYAEAGIIISLREIAEALDADRAAGHSDPTAADVVLLIRELNISNPQTVLRAAHPALFQFLAGRTPL